MTLYCMCSSDGKKVELAQRNNMEWVIDPPRVTFDKHPDGSLVVLGSGKGSC